MSMRIVALVAVIVICLVAKRGEAVMPIPTFPYITEETWFYDLDGKAGLAFAGEINPRQAGGAHFGNQVLGGRIELYRVNEDVPFYVKDDFLSVRGVQGSEEELDLGAPYYVRRIHPFFGCISTSNFVGLAWGSHLSAPPPGVVIPYHSQSQPDDVSLPLGVPEIDRDVEVWRFLGTELRPLLNYLTSETVTIIISTPYVADGVSSPSLMVQARALVDSSTTASATVEAQGFPTYSVETNNPGSSVGMLIFGEGFEEYFEEHGRPDWNLIHWASTEVPDQILLSAGLAGYKEDSVPLELTPGKDYQWRPLYVPAEDSDAPYPSMAFPESAILQRGVADQILGDCVPSQTLAVAVDPNRDGVHDAADMVVGKDEEEE